MEIFLPFLYVGALGALRQDESVFRQMTVNFGSVTHFTDLMFVRDTNEMSIPESYACQGIGLSFMPANAAGMSLSSGTPQPARGVT